MSPKNSSHIECEQEISIWQSKFRVLEGWKIEYDTDSIYSGQVSINVKHQHAIIYRKDDVCENDYILHEILHVAYRAARKLGTNKGEEILIQDLCKIIPIKRYLKWEK